MVVTSRLCLPLFRGTLSRQLPQEIGAAPGLSPPPSPGSGWLGQREGQASPPSYSGAQRPRTPPNTPTVSEPAMPSPAREDALPRSRSWVSVERLLLEAQKEREKSGSSVGSSFMDRDPRGTGLEDTPNASAWSSPMYPASPYPEWRTDVKDELNNTDWIWDWSVRVTSDMHGDDLSDHVVGPCSLVEDGVRRKLSLRNSPVMKTVLLSPRIIPWLLFTNVFSLLLGAGIGLYFGIQWYTSPPALSPPPLYRRF